MCEATVLVTAPAGERVLMRDVMMVRPAGNLLLFASSGKEVGGLGGKRVGGPVGAITAYL